MPEEKKQSESPSKSVYEEVSLDQILDPERPIRSDLSPESVEDLAKSIKQFGVINPLVVRKVGEKYEVVTGHRRLVASEIAGLVKVPIIITDKPNTINDLIKVHENLYRKDLNPVDEADYINYLIKTHKLSPSKVAELIGRSHQYVSDRLSVLNYPEDLREALTHGRVVFSVARELNKIDNKETQREYLEYAIKHGITPNVAKMWQQDLRRQEEVGVEDPKVAPVSTPPAKSQEYSVDCALCNNPVPLRESRAIYTHNSCLSQFQEIANKK